MTLQEILQAFQLGKISCAEAKKALASIQTSQDPPPQGTHKGCPYNGTDTPCEPLRTIVGASLVGALGDSPQRMERRKEAIAIVGISGRYPDARNLTAYWANLMQGKNAIREIPLARFAVSDYYDPKRAAPGKIYCKWLGALDEIEYFDPLFFALSPAEAEVMDPQGRIFLEEGYKAFEDAGYSPQLLSNRKCGVYLGISGYEYGLLLSQQQGMETDLLGTSAAIAVARIAYLLNLKGP